MAESLGKAVERLQDGANGWSPFGVVRRGDLTTVLNELERLRVQSLNTVLKAATTEPEPGAQIANAGEFAAMWNVRDEEGRETILARIQASFETAQNCFLQDHDQLVAQLEIAKHVSTVDLNRLAQYVYEEIGSAPDISLVMHMSGKGELVNALEKALARIGIRRVQQPDSWKVWYAHQDCAECEGCAEQAISYAKAANSSSQQMVKSAFGGHFGSAQRA